jgi:hypothetical protein
LVLGKINLVDLAGMERQATQHHKVEQSAAGTQAAKEMKEIHLSLNALGDVPRDLVHSFIHSFT